MQRKVVDRKVITSQNEVYIKRKLQSSLERGWEQISDIQYKNGVYGVCVQFDIVKNSRKNQMKKEVRHDKRRSEIPH